MRDGQRGDRRLDGADGPETVRMHGLGAADRDSGGAVAEDVKPGLPLEQRNLKPSDIFDAAASFTNKMMMLAGVRFKTDSMPFHVYLANESCARHHMQALIDRSQRSSRVPPVDGSMDVLGSRMNTASHQVIEDGVTLWSATHLTVAECREDIGPGHEARCNLRIVLI